MLLVYNNISIKILQTKINSSDGLKIKIYLQVTTLRRDDRLEVKKVFEEGREREREEPRPVMVLVAMAAIIFLKFSLR